MWALIFLLLNHSSTIVPLLKPVRSHFKGCYLYFFSFQVITRISNIGTQGSIVDSVDGKFYKNIVSSTDVTLCKIR